MSILPFRWFGEYKASAAVLQAELAAGAGETVGPLAGSVSVSMRRGRPDAEPLVRLRRK